MCVKYVSSKPQQKISCTITKVYCTARKQQNVMYVAKLLSQAKVFEATCKLTKLVTLIVIFVVRNLLKGITLQVILQGNIIQQRKSVQCVAIQQKVSQT